jgi:hypothetical protein
MLTLRFSVAEVVWIQFMALSGLIVAPFSSHQVLLPTPIHSRMDRSRTYSLWP